MSRSVLRRCGRSALRTWRPGGGTTLLALPPAGGSSGGFGALADSLPPSWTVVAVDPPGHGGAPGPAADADGLVAACAEIVADVAPDVVLGHSLGGVVAVETARLGVPTGRLVVVGVPGPASAAALPPLVDPDLDDDSLLRDLGRLGGVPQGLPRAGALLRHYLPALRADLRAYDSCMRRWAAAALPLDVAVPVLALSGDADPIMTPERLWSWWDSVPDVGTRTLPGGHFLPQQAPGCLAAVLVATAAEVTPR